MNQTYREAKLQRVRGMQSRSRHLGWAWFVLSGFGVYVGVEQRRFFLGFLLLCAANALFAWGLSLHRRVKRLLRLYD
jgi:hypothetical protein